MNNEQLKKLRAEFPFKWRVQSFSKSKPMAICVPYCDSRQVQDLLDSVCGPTGWQCKYEDVGGTLYCSIGIYVTTDNGGEWVWKSDCGSESNIEKEKGEASDAFKRAAVKWGIGRFLYSMRPFQIKANKKKENGDKPWHIYCVDDKGNQIPDWSITDYINHKRGSRKPVPAANVDAKGDDASTEVGTLEAWAKKYSTERVIDALKIVGTELTTAEYKRNGLSALPRVNYANFCHVVQISLYDAELIDAALEAFEFDTLADAIKNKALEKVLDECKVLKSV